jgi:hypothetical protein
MDKFAIRGVKKLFSLTRTKIRLAGESGTMETRPAPLPLVRILSGVDVNTVDGAGEYLGELRASLDFSDSEGVARTVFELLDIIEGVKYKFEPREYRALVGEVELKSMDAEARSRSSTINLLLMTDEVMDGMNVFIGEDAPKDSLHLGRVPSTLAIFLNFAFSSPYLSEGLELKNIRAILGRRTLIIHAIHFSLGEFGAGLG